MRHVLAAALVAPGGCNRVTGTIDPATGKLVGHFSMKILLERQRR